MKNSKITGGGILDDITSHQNDNAGVSSKGYQIRGVIYRYVLHCDDPEYDGKCYVGETPNEETRKSSWKNFSNVQYAGKKLVEAREKWSNDHWTYEVLETFTATDKDDYKIKSQQLETKWIAYYNSYENGFNGNRGGKGNKGVIFDEDRRKQNGDNRRGKPQPPESVKRIADKNRGRKHTKEARDKISAALTGIKRTPEQNAAQSKRLKGKEPKAASEAARKWHKEHPGGWWGTHSYSSETLAKMKAAQQRKGRKVKAVIENGESLYFATMLDAAKHFDMGAASISNFLKTGRISTKANARFYEITADEYDLHKQ